MNDARSERLPSSNWVVALEEALDELHEAVLLGAIDPLLDADAGLTRSAVVLRDLLDQVRNLPACPQVGDQRQQSGASCDAEADLRIVTRRVGDQVRQVVRDEPDLGVADLHLLTLAARTIRGIEELLDRGRS